MHEDHLYLWTFGDGCEMIRNRIVVTTLCEETLTDKSYQKILTHSFFCCNWKKRIFVRWGRTHKMRRQRRLSWRTVSVLARSDVGFGHHDRRASQHLTSCCGNFVKKESTAGLAKPFEDACPNCLQISKNFFRMAIWNLKSKIRSWRLLYHHHHHVPEGLGMLACSLILKMKLVPPSLPRSSYDSSSVWDFYNYC
jgi:hypothetical protein